MNPDQDGSGHGPRPSCPHIQAQAVLALRRRRRRLVLVRLLDGGRAEGVGIERLAGWVGRIGLAPAAVANGLAGVGHAEERENALARGLGSVGSVPG